MRNKIRLVRNEYFKKFDNTYFIFEKFPDFTFLIIYNKRDRKLKLILKIVILEIYKSLWNILVCESDLNEIE